MLRRVWRMQALPPEPFHGHDQHHEYLCARFLLSGNTNDRGFGLRILACAVFEICAIEKLCGLGSENTRIAFRVVGDMPLELPPALRDDDEGGDTLQLVKGDEVGPIRLPSHLHPAVGLPHHSPPMMKEGDDPLRAVARVDDGLPRALVEQGVFGHARRNCLLQLVKPDLRRGLQRQQPLEELDVLEQFVAVNRLELVIMITL
jgi:hypothetical protein